MRLVNPQIAIDLEQGKPLRIDLGSGPKPRPGFYGLEHALEHVDKLLPLLAEIHRITRHNPAAEVRYKMRVCKS